MKLLQATPVLEHMTTKWGFHLATRSDFLAMREHRWREGPRLGRTLCGKPIDVDAVRTDLKSIGTNEVCERCMRSLVNLRLNDPAYFALDPGETWPEV